MRNSVNTTVHLLMQECKHKNISQGDIGLAADIVHCSYDVGMMSKTSVLISKTTCNIQTKVGIRSFSDRILPSEVTKEKLHIVWEFPP